MESPALLLQMIQMHRLPCRTHKALSTLVYKIISKWMFKIRFNHLIHLLWETTLLLQRNQSCNRLLNQLCKLLNLSCKLPNQSCKLSNQSCKLLNQSCNRLLSPCNRLSNQSCSQTKTWFLNQYLNSNKIRVSSGLWSIRPLNILWMLLPPLRPR